MKFIITILLLIPTLAHAQWTGGGATPYEECGDGVDNDSSGTFGACPSGEINAVIGTGCDKLCPGDDKDGDGFVTTSTSAIRDCDDNDRTVFPGEAKTCTSGGWKTCKENGSFTPCFSTAYCNASGGGKCYYVKATGGSNSNDGLTPGAAKANYLQFVSYYQVGDRPAGWIQLNPGDSILFYDGTYTNQFSYNGANRMFNLESTSGLADFPIKIGAYPGQSPIFSNSGTFSNSNVGAIINIKNSNYIQVSGFTIQNGYGQGISISGSTGVKAYKNYIKDIDGAEASNMAGVLIGVPDVSPAVEIFLNTFKDNYDRTIATVTKNSKHLFAQAGYGKIYRNTIWNTNTSARKGMGIVLSKGNATGQ